MIFNALPLTRALFACFCMFSVPALPAVQGHGSDTAATFLQRCRLRTPNARPVCQTCLHTETKQLCLNTQQIDKFDEAVHTVFLFMPCAPYALCMLQPQPSTKVPKQPPQGKVQRYVYIYVYIYICIHIYIYVNRQKDQYIYILIYHQLLIDHMTRKGIFVAPKNLTRECQIIQ